MSQCSGLERLPTHNEYLVLTILSIVYIGIKDKPKNLQKIDFRPSRQDYSCACTFTHMHARTMTHKSSTVHKQLEFTGRIPYHRVKHKQNSKQCTNTNYRQLYSLSTLDIFGSSADNSLCEE